MRKISTQNGFTLVEILVAMAIFAVLGVLVATAMRHSLQHYQHLKKAQQLLQQQIITQKIMRNDITQIQSRPISDNKGNLHAALVSLPNGGIELTTNSRANPHGWFNRSTLQRIRYRLHNSCWVRDSWPMLDGVDDFNAAHQQLLCHIKSVQIQYVGRNGMLATSWVMSKAIHSSPLPRGIIVRLIMNNGQNIIGAYPIIAPERWMS